MQEKALSLPIGKVSFRQMGVILSGILGAMIAYFVTKDFVVPGVVLAIFLGLGLINTKIMNPDQVIKANLLFLIRGTSLSKNRPQKEKKIKIKSENNEPAKKNNTESKTKQSVVLEIILQLQSLFVKKQSDDKTKSNDYAVKIELKDNQLRIIPINNTDLESLQEKIHIMSDDIKTDFIMEDDHMSLYLDDSNYDVSAIADDRHTY